ncbi:DUF397 domain-containing protein [Streptomyces apocyni]|uniref:DUF397 domain-containing protein n=1 Tax=Streptomyces apocyni TaxID=2654677 RepID=UPI0012EAE766|nr:DUF397 domain-containing protein [Streptomyces apocyni]
MSDAVPNWHKSSYSNEAGSDCIEVADNFPGVVMIRDTKGHEKGTLHVTPDAWAAFTGMAKE